MVNINTAWTALLFFQMKQMMKYIIIVLIFGFYITNCPVYAEERYEDVSASVVVASVFQVSVDNTSLSFGSIESGKRIELYPDRYYNQVTCTSNHGKTWHLKMFAPGDLMGLGKRDIIPRESLQWRVSWTNGSGIKKEDWNDFSDTPSLVYMSGPQDNDGSDVYLQLKYALNVPNGITTDNYTAVINYTLTEAP